MRYHAKERITGPGTSSWLFEERETTLAATSMLLVRVLIAKVEKKDQLETILRNTPIREDVVGWNCVGWVQEALQRLHANGEVLGTSITEWTVIRDTAMHYCQQKKDEHRFDGQGDFDMTKAATYDLILRKETIR